MEILTKEGTFEDFIKVISDILREGEIFVDISTSLFPVFYNDEKVREAIEDRVKNHVRFRVLIDSEVEKEGLRKNVPWIFNLMKEYPDRIQIKRATEDIRHWIIVDNRIFRRESRHKIDISAKTFKVKNLIVKNPPRHIAMTLCSEFEIWWKNAEEVKGSEEV